METNNDKESERKGGVMIDSSDARKLDLDEALVNPGAVFMSPADVLTYARLSRELKLEILCRWLYDATELSVAEEEGMRASEPARVTVGIVLAALHELTGGVNVEHPAPTKHGAICARDSETESSGSAS